MIRGAKLYGDSVAVHWPRSSALTPRKREKAFTLGPRATPPHTCLRGALLSLFTLSTPRCLNAHCCAARWSHTGHAAAYVLVLYWRVNRELVSRLPAALACGLIRRGCSPANLVNARHAMAAWRAWPAADGGRLAQQARLAGQAIKPGQGASSPRRRAGI